MTGHDPHPVPAELLLVAVQRLLSESTRSGLLQSLVPLALQLLPAAQHVSVSVLGENGMVTVAASDPRARQLDAIERLVGEGPCLAAAQEGVTFRAADLAQDHRWPRLASYAADDAWVRSVLSLPLRIGEVAGSINASSAEVGAFDKVGHGHGEVLAAVAGLALLAAGEHEDAQRRASQAVQLEQFIALVGEDLHSGTATALSAAQLLDSHRSQLDDTGREALARLDDALRLRRDMILELLNRTPPGEDAR